MRYAELRSGLAALAGSEVAGVAFDDGTRAIVDSVL